MDESSKDMLFSSLMTNQTAINFQILAADKGCSFQLLKFADFRHNTCNKSNSFEAIKHPNDRVFMSKGFII